MGRGNNNTAVAEAAAAGFRTVPQEYKLFKVSELKEHPSNPHHADLGTLAESIDANGFYGAVVVQASTGFVLAGNHRFRIAATAGAATIPAIMIDVSDEAALRILAVDNRSAALGIDDKDGLRRLLEGIGDLTGSGYDIEDLEALTPDEATGKTETIFEQSVQVTPNREYVLIVADSLEEWERLRAALGLGTVRRGGYHPGSEFDQSGPARVARASSVLKRLGSE